MNECYWCEYEKSYDETWFKYDVHDKANEIDPNDEHLWSSLTLGWALGRGMNPKKAVAFSRHIRHHTRFGINETKE
ncbi:hypothetical protein LCGC14_1428520 [marine sediment metagenome]|uniref:Uncharacterized protein n=1 Tax=marine sediment metagenome TaxID=412755 RepID=A0A0F9JPM6_9ZZZZ